MLEIESGLLCETHFGFLGVRDLGSKVSGSSSGVRDSGSGSRVKSESSSGVRDSGIVGKMKQIYLAHEIQKLSHDLMLHGSPINVKKLQNVDVRRSLSNTSHDPLCKSLEVAMDNHLSNSNSNSNALGGKSKSKARASAESFKSELLAIMMLRVVLVVMSRVVL